MAPHSPTHPTPWAMAHSQCHLLPLSPPACNASPTPLFEALFEAHSSIDSSFMHAIRSTAYGRHGDFCGWSFNSTLLINWWSDGPGVKHKTRRSSSGVWTLICTTIAHLLLAWPTVYYLNKIYEWSPHKYLRNHLKIYSFFLEFFIIFHENQAIA